MQKIFISSFCVLFEDYDLLEQLCKSCPEVPMGAELGTSWPIPNFDELLDSQIPRFASGPVTLHAPFVEISGAPDSPERAAMEAAFAKAFRWYHLFGAESMVMHTHERAVPADERAQLQEWSLEAIRSTAAKAKAEGLHLTVENVGFPFKDSAYGTYGSMSFSGAGMPEENRQKDTWLFSQLIDLDELASITVCGVTYPVSP